MFDDGNSGLAGFEFKDNRVAKQIWIFGRQRGAERRKTNFSGCSKNALFFLSL